MWERQFEKIFLKYGWEKVSNWECSLVNREKTILVCLCGRKKLAGKKQNIDPIWKLLNKVVELGEPTSFLDHVHVGCTQRIKNARRKLETPVAPAMPRKTCKKSEHGETRSKTNEFKSKIACVLEASESTRLRLEESLPNLHEDHIAGKGDNSLQHYSLVHKFIPMPQAMKIHATKTTVYKEWEKLEKISAWNLTKVRSKKDVIDEARTKGAKVHFDSLMDTCHFKNAELETKHQKYKDRVVLRGDIVKDDSGSYAVFTEQGSSASQMTAAKSHGYHIQTARVRRTSS